MKRFLYLLFFMMVGYHTTAQTTLIPDPNFEFFLIHKNIDSDGVVNGQILTQDALAVTSLNIYSLNISNTYIEDLTGLEAFVNLDSLAVSNTMLNNGLDISTLTNLKYFYTADSMLETLDFSNNIMLEEVDIVNGNDVYPMNSIQELDLSNNPNIKKVFASVVPKINLNNGNNNPNMHLNIACSICQNPNPNEIEGNVCIVVDNPMAAYNNEYPYSEWVIFHTNMSYSFGDSFENCSLSTEVFEANTINIFPNPVNDLLYIESSIPIQKATLYDFLGRMILEEENTNTLSVRHLTAGNYLLKIWTNKGFYTQKIRIQ
ncbi:MAG: T9SS type A sorting domain-containing protein [Bacteroidota bacterium]|nr:T9SS type A sorting domain-containing protein [Bacteroidota bacterium]